MVNIVAFREFLQAILDFAAIFTIQSVLQTFQSVLQTSSAQSSPLKQT